jgi:hypothetical protein
LFILAPGKRKNIHTYTSVLKGDLKKKINNPLRTVESGIFCVVPFFEKMLFKGTVQRKLRGVKSGINQKVSL